MYESKYTSLSKNMDEIKHQCDQKTEKIVIMQTNLESFQNLLVEQNKETRDINT